MHRREQVGTVQVVDIGGGRAARLLRDDPAGRHEPRDGGSGLDQGLGQGGRLGGEAPEGLAERQVGQRAVTEVETVTDEDPVARLLRPVAQLGQQPGLADTGVAGQQDGVLGERLVRGQADQAGQPVRARRRGRPAGRARRVRA